MRPEILNPLFAPVSSLPGIGNRLEQVLTRLLKGGDAGEPARTVDLLFHLPHAVIDRRDRPGIADAREGAIVTLKVHVDRHQPAPRGMSRAPYRVFVHDETGEMALVFFNARSEWITRALPVGEVRHVSGRMEWFNGRASMVHPDHIVDEAGLAGLPLVEPVYPATAGLSQKVLAKAVRAALDRLPDLPEWTDPTLLTRQQWPSLAEALRRLHAPRDAADLDPRSPARRRLAHDEFLAGQLALALMRARLRRSAGRPHHAEGRLAGKLLAAFGHALTPAQRQAVDEILADMASPERMMRLLQGDVGSGKTIVALVAMAAAVESGGQATIMAPTEILARQHLATFEPLCRAAGIAVAILTGREKGPARAEILDRVAVGAVDILIGTHALLQAPVAFRDLALAVIDEQHRFGVHQRLTLGDKGGQADILVMTATPIPRTLVLTYFGDMEVSRIAGRPPGRKPVHTSAMPLDKLDELIERVAAALARGGKLYWICPLVEDNPEVAVTSAEERHRALAERFGDIVGIVHGRLSAADRDEAMAAFRDGRTRLLVATTVIEVGVDVPDATIMVIEHAERFGLAQIHQLRGRVGRGELPSTCILLYHRPLGEMARRRIEVLRQSDDGFFIAEEDLKLRGEGELLGTRQSGQPGFALASAEWRADLLELARDAARLAAATNPALDGEAGAALRTLLYLFGRDQAVRLLRAG
ncbi:MAG: ATP-dependent DNA helicase RecG [Alphaproteobacteria bacterium]|nr:MAG: ATP-dependent DNA helicase RecG [Alphaproteobacteria bacterium]